MNLKLRVRLSAMMFLQFFLWSIWYVTMGPYLREVLKFTPQQIGWVYNATAVAAMISPFFVGMVADRFFATERVMAGLHLIGALFMIAVSQATTFHVFYPLLIGHTLCFMPTIALANTLAMKQMRDPGKEFSRVIVFGTIGWIAAGQLLGLLGTRATATPISFQLAAAVSLVTAGYALTLPHTPPQGAGQSMTVRDALGLDALGLLKDRSFAVFVVAAFLFCTPLTLYFNSAAMFLQDAGIGSEASPIATGDSLVHRLLRLLGLGTLTGTMSLGQASEIVFMVAMPWFLARLGVKWVFVLAMLGWSARYFLFYLGGKGVGAWSLYSGVALHGICYVFFFVLAYIYVDQKAPEAIRTKAQGFISLVTLGLGFFVGSILSGWIVQHYTVPSAPLAHPVTQWGSVWLLAAVSGLVIMVSFALVFRHQAQPAPSSSPA